MNDCSNKECGGTGHYRVPGVGVVRCQCLEKKILRRDLGPLYAEVIPGTSPLQQYESTSVVMDGNFESLKPHVSRVVLNLRTQGKTVKIIDCYRLIEIFLEKDAEYTTTSQVESDLLIILLGFGDPRNKYLPELVTQVLERRRLESRPTWVVLGIQLGQVAVRYSVDLMERLSALRRVVTK